MNRAGGRGGKEGKIGRRLMRGVGEGKDRTTNQGSILENRQNTNRGYIYNHLTDSLELCPRIEVVDNILIVLFIQFYAG